MAVQGKLVPQEPADEPAEALLERIRAEKARLVKEGNIKKDRLIISSWAALLLRPNSNINQQKISPNLILIKQFQTVILNVAIHTIHDPICCCNTRDNTFFDNGWQHHNGMPG